MSAICSTLACLQKSRNSDTSGEQIEQKPLDSCVLEENVQLQPEPKRDPYHPCLDNDSDNDHLNSSNFDSSESHSCERLNKFKPSAIRPTKSLPSFA